MLYFLLNGIDSTSPPHINEYVFLQTTATQNTTWTVPAGVTSICVVCVGTGIIGGGGLSYRNNIPVTPGEVLSIQFTVTTVNTPDGGFSRLARNGTVLCIAHAGAVATLGGSVFGGYGGKSASSVNDGGGNGGKGIINDYTSVKTYANAGAGGYAGTGGAGENRAAVSTAGVAGYGGGSGARVYGTTPSVGNFVGGSVGLYGIGDSGATAPLSTLSSGNDGSVASVMCGGGSYTSASSYNINGGIRIIWGDGVSFPNNAK